MLFSPLWAVSIERMGFPAAAMVLGLAMIAVVLRIARGMLSRTPSAEESSAPAPAAVRGSLWQDRRFLTLAAAMSLGLFAQIGLIAQLFSLLAPGMGAQHAGGIMALATGCGMAGRLLTARLLGRYPQRRSAAAASYALQAAGTLLLFAGAEALALVVPGIVLFGLGMGNATSLPPLIAQADFAPADVPRVVARSAALSQALYAFAPAVLAGLLLGAAHTTPSLGASTDAYFCAIFLLQILAAVCVLGTRRPMRRLRPAQ